MYTSDLYWLFCLLLFLCISTPGLCARVSGKLEKQCLMLKGHLCLNSCQSLQPTESFTVTLGWCTSDQQPDAPNYISTMHKKKTQAMWLEGLGITQKCYHSYHLWHMLIYSVKLVLYTVKCYLKWYSHFGNMLHLYNDQLHNNPNYFVNNSFFFGSAQWLSGNRCRLTAIK